MHHDEIKEVWDTDRKICILFNHLRSSWNCIFIASISHWHMSSHFMCQKRASHKDMSGNLKHQQKQTNKQGNHNHITRILQTWLQASTQAHTHCSVKMDLKHERGWKEGNKCNLRLSPKTHRDKVYKNIYRPLLNETKMLSWQQTVRLRSSSTKGSQAWNYMCFHHSFSESREILNGPLFQGFRSLPYLCS